MSADMCAHGQLLTKSKRTGELPGKRVIRLHRYGWNARHAVLLDWIDPVDSRDKHGPSISNNRGKIMGVSRFDPLAGGITAQSYAKALSEIQRAESRAPEPRSSGKGKCQCCGAWEYVMTKAGEICSYCRVPSWANSREPSPHPGVTGDKGWYAAMAAESQRAKNKVILRFALGADAGIIRQD